MSGTHEGRGAGRRGHEDPSVIDSALRELSVEVDTDTKKYNAEQRVNKSHTPLKVLVPGQRRYQPRWNFSKRNCH